MRAEVGRLMRELPFPPAAKNDIVMEDNVQKLMCREIRASLPGDANKYDLASFADHLGTINDSLLMAGAIDCQRNLSLDIRILEHRGRHVLDARIPSDP